MPKCLRARPKAERVLLRIRGNPEYERRPAGRGDAFERLIPLEPKARLTSGLLWWVPPSLLPCMGPMPNHASTHCGTWRVLPGEMSQMFHLLFLANGWADCVKIWHALGDPLVTAHAVVTAHGWDISARAHVQRSVVDQYWSVRHTAFVVRHSVMRHPSRTAVVWRLWRRPAPAGGGGGRGDPSVGAVGSRRGRRSGYLPEYDGESAECGNECEGCGFFAVA